MPGHTENLAQSPDAPYLHAMASVMTVPANRHTDLEPWRKCNQQRAVASPSSAVATTTFDRQLRPKNENCRSIPRISRIINKSGEFHIPFWSHFDPISAPPDPKNGTQNPSNWLQSTPHLCPGRRVLSPQPPAHGRSEALLPGHYQRAIYGTLPQAPAVTRRKNAPGPGPRLDATHKSLDATHKSFDATHKISHLPGNWVPLSPTHGGRTTP